MQNMTVELHDSSSGGGRSKASDSHEYSLLADRKEARHGPKDEIPDQLKGES
jgi:hypothetical protein